jgi:hypothetical protein
VLIAKEPGQGGVPMVVAQAVTLFKLLADEQRFLESTGRT